VKEQAEREAQLILREAKAEGERIVAAAANESRKVEQDIEGLIRQRRAYLLQLRSMAERQLAEVAAAESSTGPARPAASEPAPVPSATPLWLDSVVKD
jgi:cell division initiation protein